MDYGNLELNEALAVIRSLDDAVAQLRSRLLERDHLMAQMLRECNDLGLCVDNVRVKLEALRRTGAPS